MDAALRNFVKLAYWLSGKHRKLVLGSADWLDEDLYPSADAETMQPLRDAGVVALEFFLGRKPGTENAEHRAVAHLEDGRTFLILVDFDLSSHMDDVFKKGTPAFLYKDTAVYILQTWMERERLFMGESPDGRWRFGRRKASEELVTHPELYRESYNAEYPECDFSRAALAKMFAAFAKEAADAVVDRFPEAERLRHRPPKENPLVAKVARAFPERMRAQALAHEERKALGVSLSENGAQKSHGATAGAADASEPDAQLRPAGKPARI
jgi:hypothetical protein